MRKNVILLEISNVFTNDFKKGFNFHYDSWNFNLCFRFTQINLHYEWYQVLEVCLHFVLYRILGDSYHLSLHFFWVFLGRSHSEVRSVLKRASGCSRSGCFSSSRRGTASRCRAWLPKSCSKHWRGRRRPNVPLTSLSSHHLACPLPLSDLTRASPHLLN